MPTCACTPCACRWLTEEGQKTGSWIGFGGGPRMCLGYLLALAELKVAPCLPACQSRFCRPDSVSALCPPLLPSSWMACAVWVQVLLAVLARGYDFNPLDPNEPFSNFPVGGEPINGLLMDFEKKTSPHSVST